MSDLTNLRDHARSRADWQPGEARAACKERTAFGSPKPADHANCGGHQCGCRCHEPTDRERHLWRQIAGELTDYLADDSDVDLFGELTEMPQASEEVPTACATGSPVDAEAGMAPVDVQGSARPSDPVFDQGDAK